MTLTREVLPVNRRSLGPRLIVATLVLVGVLAVEQCGRSVRTRLDWNLRDWPMPTSAHRDPLSDCQACGVARVASPGLGLGRREQAAEGRERLGGLGVHAHWFGRSRQLQRCCWGIRTAGAERVQVYGMASRACVSRVSELRRIDIVRVRSYYGDMMNTAANEKRINKMARYEARKIMSLRRSGMVEQANELEAEATARADRMRAGLE